MTSTSTDGILIIRTSYQLPKKYWLTHLTKSRAENWVSECVIVLWAVMVDDHDMFLSLRCLHVSDKDQSRVAGVYQSHSPSLLTKQREEHNISQSMQDTGTINTSDKYQAVHPRHLWTVISDDKYFFKPTHCCRSWLSVASPRSWSTGSSHQTSRANCPPSPWPATCLSSRRGLAWSRGSSRQLCKTSSRWTSTMISM